MFCSSRRGAAVSGGTLRHLSLRDLKVDRRSLPLLATLKFKSDLLIFAEGAQSCSLNGRDMDEYVFRAVIGLNKSIALLGVEPLYCSASHRTFLQINSAVIQRWMTGQISARNGKQVQRSIAS